MIVHALTATFESASVATREVEHYLRVCAGDHVIVHCVDCTFPDERCCVMSVWWSVAPTPRRWHLVGLDGSSLVVL